MSNYIIHSISKEDYGDYTDVIRIVVTKKKGFLASLFSSSNPITIILSEESLLIKSAKEAFSSKKMWKIDDVNFTTEEDYNEYFFIETNFKHYEKIKTNKIMAKKAQEERLLEAKRQHEKSLKEKERRDANRIKKKDVKADKKKQYLEKKGKREALNAPCGIINDTSVDPIFSEQMSVVAFNANRNFYTDNTKATSNYLVQLYNMVHGYNSHKLKTLSPKDGMIVGLAFVKMTLYFNNGDFQVNEIAGQNAYYSLMKNYYGTNNINALISVFTLLRKKPLALVDELYRVNPDNTLVGYGGGSLRAPFVRRERAMNNRLVIMKYLLDKFYVTDTGKYKNGVDLMEHLLTNSDVQSFLKEYSASEYWSNPSVNELGEQYVKELYKDIEEQLDVEENPMDWISRLDLLAH